MIYVHSISHKIYYTLLKTTISNTILFYLPFSSLKINFFWFNEQPFIHSTFNYFNNNINHWFFSFLTNSKKTLQPNSSAHQFTLASVCIAISVPKLLYGRIHFSQIFSRNKTHSLWWTTKMWLTATPRILNYQKTIVNVWFL